MKKKYLFMLPAMSFAASTSAFAQDVATVPAAAHVNMKAEFSEAKPAKEMFDSLTEIINNFAKEEGEEIDAKAVLSALGLDEINSYAMSSEKDGNLWINQMFLHNKGSDNGIFPLLGKKNADFTVPSFTPADADLAFQVELDLKTAEKLISSVLKAANAPADVMEEFNAGMAEEVPTLGMTSSELLAKLDVRLNVVMDLNPAVKLALPLVGQIDTPNLLIRIDGVGWAAAQAADALIAQIGIPFEKKEADGVTTYSLPAQMAAQFLGYSPVISIDTKNDHVSISSTPEFLAKCIEAGDKLSKSADFTAATAGFTQKGNSMTYVSVEFAQFIVKLMEIAQANGLMEHMGEEEKVQLDKSFALLKKIDKDIFTSFARTNDGIKMSERGAQDLKTTIEDAKKQLETVIETL